MLAAALLISAVTPAPQAGGDLKVKVENGFTLKYDELSDKDAQAILSSLKTAREVFANAYAMQVEIDPVVTLRQHPGARRMVWTDGDDRIFFDFPSNEYYLFAQMADDRIIKVALPAFVQLWLARSLTSMAGLDPRIAESIVEFADYSYKASLPPTPGKDPPAPPTGPGRVWYEIEQVYPGTSGLIMNSLMTQKIPGHMLGNYLRNTAFALTSDEHVKALFDGISPPIPLLAPKDAVPSPAIHQVNAAGAAPATGAKDPAQPGKDPAHAAKEPPPAAKDPAPPATDGSAGDVSTRIRRGRAARCAASALQRRAAVRGDGAADLPRRPAPRLRARLRLDDALDTRLRRRRAAADGARRRRLEGVLRVPPSRRARARRHRLHARGARVPGALLRRVAAPRGDDQGLLPARRAALEQRHRARHGRGRRHDRGLEGDRQLRSGRRA
jgi:hypothetical protein